MARFTITETTTFTTADQRTRTITVDVLDVAVLAEWVAARPAPCGNPERVAGLLVDGLAEDGDTVAQARCTYTLTVEQDDEDEQDEQGTAITAEQREDEGEVVEQGQAGHGAGVWLQGAQGGPDESQGLQALQTLQGVHSAAHGLQTGPVLQSVQGAAGGSLVAVEDAGEVSLQDVERQVERVGCDPRRYDLPYLRRLVAVRQGWARLEGHHVSLLGEDETAALVRIAVRLDLVGA